MQGSTTHAGADRHGTVGPHLDDRPRRLVAEHNGKVPMEASVGDGPVLWANRWRSLPQIPPVVTATRAQDEPGSSGSGSSVNEAGKSGSAMSNTTAHIARA